MTESLRVDPSLLCRLPGAAQLMWYVVAVVHHSIEESNSTSKFHMLPLGGRIKVLISGWRL
jgi:hypothetical protein